MFPEDKLFSRQQFGQITGIPDDVLGFWMKEGLLVPIASEARTHRRFEYIQLNIAVVLNAMRSLGANIGVLRKFAESMQIGVTVAKRSGLPREKLNGGDRLALSLNTFRRGEYVAVRNEAYDAALNAIPRTDWRARNDLWDKVPHDRAAESEHEIEQEWLGMYGGDADYTEALPLFRCLTDFEANGLDLYLDLTMPDIVKPGQGRFDWNWVAWLDDAGTPKVLSGEAGNVYNYFELAPVAAFYLSISRLIRPLWVQDDPRLTDSPATGQAEA